MKALGSAGGSSGFSKSAGSPHGPTWHRTSCCRLLGSALVGSPRRCAGVQAPPSLLPLGHNESPPTPFTPHSPPLSVTAGIAACDNGGVACNPESRLTLGSTKAALARTGHWPRWRCQLLCAIAGSLSPAAQLEDALAGWQLNSGKVPVRRLCRLSQRHRRGRASAAPCCCRLLLS